jgi:hypothetical protein
MEEETKRTEETVTDAETLEVRSEEVMEDSKKSTTKKKKTDFYIELALFLILGMLVGIAIKTEATKRVTIGYDDYKMKMAKQDYDINKLQSDLSKQSAAAASQGTDNSSVQGAENNNLGDAQNNASNNANN